MKTNLSAIEEALMEDLDSSAVRTRTKGGMTLSYIDGFYVKDRLCKVFGPLGFETSFDDMRLVSDTEKDGKHRVSYTVMCSLTGRVRSADDGFVTYVTKSDVGFGQGIDRDHGQAHESAVKEATTDALKRAAVLFGRSMGLALYDKDQSHVTSEPVSKAEGRRTAAQKKSKKEPEPATDDDGSAVSLRIAAATDLVSLEAIKPAIRAFRGKDEHTFQKLITDYRDREAVLEKEA